MAARPAEGTALIDDVVVEDDVENEEEEGDAERTRAGAKGGARGNAEGGVQERSHADLPSRNLAPLVPTTSLSAISGSPASFAFPVGSGLPAVSDLSAISGLSSAFAFLRLPSRYPVICSRKHPVISMLTNRLETGASRTQMRR